MIMKPTLLSDIIEKIYRLYPSISFDYDQKDSSLLFSFHSDKDRKIIWGYMLYYQKFYPDRVALVVPHPKKKAKDYILEMVPLKMYCPY